MTQFYETRMGVRFYEHTLPELVRQIERLNQNLERLVDPHVRAGEHQPKKENDNDPESRTEEGTQPPHA